MSKKKTDKESNLQNQTGPIPVGTPLHRVLEAVAQTIAEQRIEQQTKESDEIPGDGIERRR